MRPCLTVIFALLHVCVFSQQQLNLDFENVSIEGASRPWGWNVEAAGSAGDITLDTGRPHGGNYSLALRGRPDTLQSVSEDLEPYALTGKTIRIEGWIRTEQLQGVASVEMNYLSDSLTTAFKKEVKKNTFAWTLISAEGKIPAGAKGVSIALRLKGSGKAWFDDLRLVINGRRLAEVPVAAGFTGQQLNWLQRNTVPLLSVDAVQPGTASPDPDLERFKEIAGDARIIALGESTHGTSEFFRMKHRLLEYAVQELGTRIFAIEDNQLIVERVNRYVLGGAGTARKSMYGLFSVWQNQEVLNLIKWVRAYNDGHPGDKVFFVGFDLQDPAQPLDSAFSFIKRKEPQFYDTFAALLRDLKAGWKNSWSASDSVKTEWYHNARSALDLVSSKKQQWLAAAKTRQDSTEAEWGWQYVNLVKQYAENTMKGHLSLYRDVAMAENISWLLSMHPPGTKMVVWAHDNHISRGDHAEAEKNYYNGISMGAHLSKKYGSAYKAFGQFTYAGSYRAQVSYMDFKQVSCPLYPGPVGSLDEALHRVSVEKRAPAFLLDLRAARKEAWLSAPIPVRFANHVCMEYAYWTRFSIPYQFDGIIFIDRTSGAQPATDK